MGICKSDPSDVLVERLSDEYTFTLKNKPKITSQIALILKCDQHKMLAVGTCDGRIYLNKFTGISDGQLIFFDTTLFVLNQFKVFSGDLFGQFLIVHAGNRIWLIDCLNRKVVGPPTEMIYFEYIFCVSLHGVQSGVSSRRDRLQFTVCGQLVPNLSEKYISIESFFHLTHVPYYKDYIKYIEGKLTVDPDQIIDDKPNLFLSRGKLENRKTKIPDALLGYAKAELDRQVTDREIPIKIELTKKHEKAPPSVLDDMYSQSDSAKFGTEPKKVSANDKQRLFQLMYNKLKIKAKKAKHQKKTKTKHKAKAKLTQKPKPAAKKQVKQLNWQAKYNRLLDKYNNLVRCHEETEKNHRQQIAQLAKSKHKPNGHNQLLLTQSNRVLDRVSETKMDPDKPQFTHDLDNADIRSGYNHRRKPEILLMVSALKNQLVELHRRVSSQIINYKQAIRAMQAEIRMSSTTCQICASDVPDLQSSSKNPKIYIDFACLNKNYRTSLQLFRNIGRLVGFMPDTTGRF